MAEVTQYTLYFTVVDTEDMIPKPEVAFVDEGNGRFDLLASYTPPHEPYEDIAEENPSYGELAAHNNAYEEELIELLDNLSGEYEAVIGAVMAYHRAGGDLLHLARVIRDMD